MYKESTYSNAYNTDIGLHNKMGTYLYPYMHVYTEYKPDSIYKHYCFEGTKMNFCLGYALTRRSYKSGSAI